MRRAAGLAVAVLFLLAASASSAQPKLPLSHSGRWITDAAGRVVILHGTNMVYKVAPYYPSAAGFGDDDAAFLSRIGFNAVRVGVIWKAVEPQPGIYNDRYLRQIASTVNLLARHRIVSLLDFHQDMYNETFQGEGFPDWSVQDDGLPHQPQRGFNQNYFVMAALQRAYDHFWENSPGSGGVGLQDRFAAAWRHVALRFRANRNVLGYELMNEPFPGSTWQACATLNGCPVFDAMLTAFTRRLVANIRTVDRRTLIWYEPNVAFDFGPDTAMGPIGDPRAGFSFHDYCFEFGASGTTNSCGMFGDLVVSNAIKRSGQTGDALLMTEWGDPDYSLMQAMVQRDDRSMVPWLEWSYCPCHDPTGAASKTALVRDPAQPPTGSNLNAPGLAIFAEPYPQLISGTPLAWGLDTSTRRFSLTYSTARAEGGGRFRAGSLTEVATPARVYGGRYSVRASGAAVVSSPGAPLLVLASCRGARTISVTVSPSKRARSPSSCHRAVRAGRHPGSR